MRGSGSVLTLLGTILVLAWACSEDRGAGPRPSATREEAAGKPDSRSPESLLPSTRSEEPGRKLLESGEKQPAEPASLEETDPSPEESQETSVRERPSGWGVTGRILDELSDPVFGATVTLAQPGLDDGSGSPPRQFLAESDSGGVFHVEGTRAGPGFALMVTHQDFAPMVRWDLYIYQRKITEVGEIHLRHGITIQGWVRDESGAPVPNAHIQVLGPSKEAAAVARLPSGAPYLWPEASTGMDGKFLLRNLVSGVYDLNLTCSGFQAVTLTRVKCDQHRRPLSFTLKTGLPLQGIVMDFLGKPIAEARIEIAPVGEKHPAPVDQRRCVTTGPEGGFTIHDLSPVPFNLVVSAPGFLIRRMRGVHPGNQTHTIVLERCAAVEGIVTDADTGKPLDEFMVTVLDLSEIGERQEEEEGVAVRRTFRGVKDGRFFMDCLKPFHCMVEVRAPGRAYQLSRPVELKPGETAGGLSFRLGKCAYIEGVVVVDQTLYPLEGAQVVAIAVSSGQKNKESSPEENKAVEIMGRVPSHIVARTRTDAEGLFVLGNLAPGKYEVRIAAEAFLEKRLTGIELDTAGSREFFLVEAQRGGVVEGITRGAGGEPVPGVQVFLRDGKGGNKGQTVSGDNGLFRFCGLPAGSYSLQAVMHRLRKGHDMIFRPGTTDVRPGLVNRCDLHTQEQSVLLGKARRIDVPQPGIMVVMTRTGEEGEGVSSASWHVWSDAQGDFCVADLPPGRYSFAAYSAAGVLLSSRKVNVIPRSVVHEDVNLSGGRLFGRVEALVTGRPLAGVNLRVFSERTGEESGQSGASFHAEGVETGKDGRFEVPFIPSGRYRLEAWKSGYVVNVLRGVQVNKDDSVGPYKVQLEGGGVIQGLVLDSRNNRSWLTTFVRVCDESGNPVPGPMGLMLARGGRFRIRGVKPGTYHLRFLRPGYEGKTKWIEVKVGMNPMVRVVLE